jgi:SAM-dependent methyltransferase
MPDFSKRSYQQELLDRDDIPFADIKKNMQELDFINTHLGGHKITLSGFRSLLNQKPELKKKTISILEIGCGGGDNLRVIKRFCEKKKLGAELTGVDINPNCIEFARSRKENIGIRFIASDYKLVKLENKPDIIFSSLFCHHFNDEQMTEIISWMKNNSAIGFFINDLHRHYLAYYSIKWLTKFFSKSYLVKNDAPLSVMRGFTRDELKNFFDQQSFNPTQLKWKWAFRWLIVYTHE